MADITSRDFQELIKRQKETTDKLETIVRQNVEGNSVRERFLDALPEIANDTRLASQREKFDVKEGITRTDDLQEQTTEEVKKGTAATQKLIEKVDKGNDKEESSAKKIEESVEKQGGFLKNLMPQFLTSKEDKKDEKRLFTKLSDNIKGFGDFLTNIPLIGGPIEGIFSIFKRLFQGGVLATLLVVLENFVNSPLFDKFLDGLANFIDKIIEITTGVKKKTPGIIASYKKEFDDANDGSILGIFKGIFAVVKKGAIDYKNRFAKAIENDEYFVLAALAALPLVIFSVVKRVTGLVTGILTMLGGKKLLGMLGKLKPKPGASAGATVAGSGKTASSGFKMGAMNPETVKKINTLQKFGKVGIVGSAITGGLALAPDVMTLTDDEATDFEKQQAKKGIGRTTTGLGSALALGAAGSKYGAMGGFALGGPVGSAFGGLLGGLVGGTAGFVSGTGLFDAVSNFFGKDKGFPDSDIEKRSKEIQKIMSEKEFERFKQLQDERKIALEKLGKMLDSGEISKAEYDKAFDDIKDYFDESKEYQRLLNKLKKVFKEEPSIKEEIMHRSPHLLELTKANTKVLPKKMDELIRLSEENNKLLSQGTTFNSQIFGGSTNIQNNPTNTTVVSDVHLKDSYQYFRNAYG